MNVIKSVQVQAQERLQRIRDRERRNAEHQSAEAAEAARAQGPEAKKLKLAGEAVASGSTADETHLTTEPTGSGEDMKRRKLNPPEGGSVTRAAERLGDSVSLQVLIREALSELSTGKSE